VFHFRTNDDSAKVRRIGDVHFGSKADMTPNFAMSALPPKADMDQSAWNVRFVPKADMVARTVPSSESMLPPTINPTRLLRRTYSDKKNVIAVTLTRLTNKADTSGRITKALGDGPYRLVTAVMAAIAVGVEPSDMPANPALSTAAW
jgi:hypothetical protein